jgi:hypothetical protein
LASSNLLSGSHDEISLNPVQLSLYSFAAFGMDPAVFYSSFTLLALHVWLVVHRLAAENDRDGRFFKQRFYNHFQVHGLDKGGLHVERNPMVVAD